MNVIQEQIDDLNAVLTVKLSPEDYKEKVKKSLRDYAKKVSMPGFRSGMVPFDLVKKMHGKAILIEEINRILQESIESYIRDNKLELLGNALPSALNREKEVDWNNDENFEFKFDIAFAPKFDLKISGETLNNKKVLIDDSTINTYSDNIAKRYGKIEYPNVVEDSSLIYLDFVELDSNGEILAGGIFKNSPISMEKANNEVAKQLFIGKSIGDIVEVNPNELAENPTDLSAMLGIETSRIDSISKKFQAKVTAISKMVAAELNEELFEKVYGSAVKTEEEFKNKIKEELELMFEADSKRMLKNEVQKILIDKTNLTLPNEFLKRWIMTVNEKPLTAEELDRDFERYADGLRWQLIENKLIKENNISVSPDEAKVFVKELLKKQFASFNNFDMEDEKMESTIKSILENQEQAQNIYQQLYDSKLMDLYKTMFTFKDIAVPEKEFYQLT